MHTATRAYRTFCSLRLRGAAKHKRKSTNTETNMMYGGTRRERRAMRRMALPQVQMPGRTEVRMVGGSTCGSGGGERFPVGSLPACVSPEKGANVVERLNEIFGETVGTGTSCLSIAGILLIFLGIILFIVPWFAFPDSTDWSNSWSTTRSYTSLKGVLGMIGCVLVFTGAMLKVCASRARMASIVSAVSLMQNHLNDVNAKDPLSPVTWLVEQDLLGRRWSRGGAGLPMLVVLDKAVAAAAAQPGVMTVINMAQPQFPQPQQMPLPVAPAVPVPVVEAPPPYQPHAMPPSVPEAATDTDCGTSAKKLDMTV